MVRVTVKGFTVEIPDEVARRIVEFDRTCREAGGVTQIRTSMYGIEGFGRNVIQLVCWGASGKVKNVYIPVTPDLAKSLAGLIKMKGIRVADLIEALHKAGIR
ncbi:MAG: hypothetical protein DRJ40_08110 [Thermoprotei archaeon]|nr:MAG: hypothetical protein DRJ40_08110 [Thermoprotei archaeon]